MIHITYIGNFLSEHGLNPTYSEALVPQLSKDFLIRPASRYLNPVLRMMDMILAVLKTPKKDACVILDLCSGPRAFPAADLISRLCRISGKPYVVVLHGGTLPRLLARQRARLLNILKGAKRVVSPSSYLADTFSDYVNVEIIPNALNIDDYPFKARNRAQPTFLYLRAFHNWYGPLTALKAFAMVHEKYAAARLMMAGPELDDALPKCKALAKELGIEGNVEFLGRVPKSRIPELGKACDIFVNPTFVDNTPVSVVEAMAMGMCLVATNVGGLPYLIKNGETGLLVSPGDEKQMASAMLDLLERPDLAARLSHNARKIAEKMDWRAVKPQWVSVIQSAAWSS